MTTSNGEFSVTYAPQPFFFGGRVLKQCDGRFAYERIMEA